MKPSTTFSTFAFDAVTTWAYGFGVSIRFRSRSAIHQTGGLHRIQADAIIGRTQIAFRPELRESDLVDLTPPLILRPRGDAATGGRQITSSEKRGGAIMLAGTIVLTMCTLFASDVLAADGDPRPCPLDKLPTLSGNVSGDETKIAGAGCFFNGDLVNAKKYTDFHLSISGGETVSKGCVGTITVNGGTAVPGTTTGDDTKEVKIKWDVEIPLGAKVEYSFVCTQPNNNDFSWKANLTPAASPTDLPTLGWRITPAGDVFLTNHYTESAISFGSLLFQFPDGIDVNSMLNLPTTVASGVSGVVSSGIVSAAMIIAGMSIPGELPVASFPFLEPGDFLTATFDSAFVDTSFSPNAISNAIGHSHQAPEPSTGLLLAGSLAVLWINRRRRSR